MCRAAAAAAAAAWRRKEVVNVVTGIRYHADIFEALLGVMQCLLYSLSKNNVLCLSINGLFISLYQGVSSVIRLKSLKCNYGETEK